ncbi:MAG: methyl-accepting chemotaxis protein [Steroidobacteraceae bacterium]
MRTPSEITVSFLGRLRLWQKLALLMAAMAVPAVLLGCFYFGQAAAGTRQAREELDGARYLKALGRVSGEILTHRGRAYAFLIGDKAQRTPVISQAAQVDRQILAVDAIDSEVGARLGVAAEWQAVKSEWASLESRTFQHTADEGDAAHVALAGHLARLAEDVGARSMTSFDPEESTRALVRVASDYAPDLLMFSGDMRRHAVRAATKGYLGGDDRMAIRTFRDRQVALLETLDGTLEHLPADVRAVLQPAADSARSTSDTFYALIQTKLLNAANVDVSGSEIHDAGVATHSALKNVSLASYDLLTSRVGQRLSRLSQRRALTAGISGTLLGLAFVLGWLISRSLAQRLNQAVTGFDHIAAGDYGNPLELQGRDEAGELLRALDEMQGRLRTQLETERTVAAENSRIRQALDKASTSVVLADARHEIIYLNDTAQHTFVRSESEIRKLLPEFAAQRLRGSSLARLSSDPQREHRMLDSLVGPEVRERTVGALTLRKVISPVIGERGERIGTVVEWSDRTEEVAVEKQLQSMLSAVVDGDLTRRIALEGKTGFFAAASRSVNQLADNMAEIVSLVKGAAGEVYRGSQEISTGNTNLQMRTEKQSASLQQTASSMEEMTTTVKQNADNAGQANQLAAAAREQAEQGGSVVGKAVHAMSDINDSARKIADIIGVIDEIAFQTNLLALNAAVEAARAGEQGRGFAVVATEVRTLAGRSATAAKQIKELIQDSVRKVEDGSVLVTQSGRTLEQIVASVKKVSDIVAEIAAASREQSAGIGQVNRAVVQMDDLTQQNAALVEQAATASQAMAQEAHALYQMMDGYRLGALARDSGMRAGSGFRVRAGRDSGNARTDIEQAVDIEPVVGAAVSQSDTAAKPAPRLAAAGDDSEWQEF